MVKEGDLVRQIGGVDVGLEGTVVDVTSKMLWYETKDGTRHHCMKTNVQVLTNETPCKDPPAANTLRKAKPKSLMLDSESRVSPTLPADCDPPAPLEDFLQLRKVYTNILQ
jgi:predicted heme/steroid binding protein